MSAPEISVVIPTLNAGEMLLTCVRSVLTNTRAPLEVIVIDNGSTDESPSRLAREIPSVRLLRNTRNMGFARAVNRGVQEATGEFVCILNNDAEIRPQAIDRLVGFLRAHPDIGIVGPQLEHSDGSLQNSFDNFPTLLDQIVNKSVLRWLCPRRFPSKRQVTAGPVDVESVVGACMVISRDLYRDVGALDEGFFIYFEETDLCLRIRRMGKRIVVVPEARVGHMGGATKKRSPHRGRVEYTRSLFRYFQRDSRGYLLLRLLYPIKILFASLIALVGNLATLFCVRHYRLKLRTYLWLLLWLLLFCPKHFGLEDE